MTADYEAQIRKFDLNLVDLFKELQSGLAVDLDKLQPVISAAYKQALSELSTPLRALDDIIAIIKIGEADSVPEEKYRKIRAALVGKGLINE